MAQRVTRQQAKAQAKAQAKDQAKAQAKAATVPSATPLSAEVLMCSAAGSPAEGLVFLPPQAPLPPEIVKHPEAAPSLGYLTGHGVPAAGIPRYHTPAPPDLSGKVKAKR
jgi:hypothetical protein